MSGAFYSLMLVLAVVFVIILLSAIIKNQVSYIYTKADMEKDSIEWTVRDIISKNPTSRIVIITYGENCEEEKILEILRKDFPQIHIIRNKK